MRVLVLVLLLVLAVPAAAATTRASDPLPPRPPKPPTATSFTGRPAVGALLMWDGLGPHFCTATVVPSRGRDLLLTAAHCLFENETGPQRRNVAFVPGYHDLKRPHGTWRALEFIVDDRWRHGADPDYDVAFVRLEKRHGLGIEDAVGAHPLLFDRNEHVVDVPGYPVLATRPITCRNWTTEFSPSQRGFDCRGYLEGTSGGPWLTARGELVGVVGGFQYGGDMILHNYSPYFGEHVRRLYDQANRASGHTHRGEGR